jgi:hypothetical protein
MIHFPARKHRELVDNGDQPEQRMKAFDTDLTYGPALGITRIQRAQRARLLGLNPPNVELEIKRGALELSVWDQVPGKDNHKKDK